MSSISLYSICQPLEQALSSFFDKVISEQGKWKTKTDLIQLWNTGSLVESVSSRIIIKEAEKPKKEEEKKLDTVSEHSVTPNTTNVSKDTGQCTFKITRGDKMGEQCMSRAKFDTFCAKHYRGDKSKPAEKPIETEPLPTSTSSSVHPSPVIEQKMFVALSTDMTTLDLKLKKKPVKSVEWTQKGPHRVINNTSVVINDQNQVLGYLDKDKLVCSSNAEVVKVQKEFSLQFFSEDEIDE
jgi:hypothetical protein